MTERLIRLDENLWCAQSEVKIPATTMPVRMTVPRLADGSLVLVSPVTIDDALARELGELGAVRHVVAPNGLHHLHLAAAAARYPEARVYGVASLVEKRGDVRFDELLADSPADADEMLGSGAPDAWGDEIETLKIEGAPSLDEVVLLHRPSASLIVTDLLFNVQDGPFSRQLVLRMTGTWKRLAQSRAWRFLLKDREAGARSAARLLEWPFRRLVPAHGDVAEDAYGAVGAALARMLGTAKVDQGSGSESASMSTG